MHKRIAEVTVDMLTFLSSGLVKPDLLGMSHDTPNTTTTMYNPQPPASTTITSTTYSAPAPTSAATSTTTGLSDTARTEEVVNSIVSSPPIVSDHQEEFFRNLSQSEVQQQQHSGRVGVGEGRREDMRETLRRAAEARMGHQQQQQQQPHLEPDELD